MGKNTFRMKDLNYVVGESCDHCGAIKFPSSLRLLLLSGEKVCASCHRISNRSVEHLRANRSYQALRRAMTVYKYELEKQKGYLKYIERYGLYTEPKDSNARVSVTSTPDPVIVEGDNSLVKWDRLTKNLKQVAEKEQVTNKPAYRHLLTLISSLKKAHVPSPHSADLSPYEDFAEIYWRFNNHDFRQVCSVIIAAETYSCYISLFDKKKEQQVYSGSVDGNLPEQMERLIDLLETECSSFSLLNE